jgi:hypothetical protein
VSEEAAAATLDDPEVQAAAHQVLEAIRTQPGGAETLTAVGDYIAQASGGSSASVNVSHAPPQQGAR